jgi:hypothetical protein
MARNLQENKTMLDFETAMQRAEDQIWDEDDASGRYVISYDGMEYIILHEEDPEAYAPGVKDRYFVEAFFEI